MKPSSTIQTIFRSVVLLFFLAYLPLAAVAPNLLSNVFAFLKEQPGEVELDEAVSLKPIAFQSREQVTPKKDYTVKLLSAVEPVNANIPNSTPQKTNQQQMHEKKTSQAVMYNSLSHEIEAKLRRLGAKSYRLTSSGKAPTGYQFSCSVGYTENHQEMAQRFQSSANHPLTAMQMVLAQVENWYSQRQFSVVSNIK